MERTISAYEEITIDMRRCCIVEVRQRIWPKLEETDGFHVIAIRHSSGCLNLACDSKLSMGASSRHHIVGISGEAKERNERDHNS